MKTVQLMVRLDNVRYSTIRPRHLNDKTPTRIFHQQFILHASVVCVFKQTQTAASTAYIPRDNITARLND